MHLALTGSPKCFSGIVELFRWQDGPEFLLASISWLDVYLHHHYDLAYLLMCDIYNYVHVYMINEVMMVQSTCLTTLSFFSAEPPTGLLNGSLTYSPYFLKFGW